jgi:hypothetical protein
MKIRVLVFFVALISFTACSKEGEGLNANQDKIQFGTLSLRCVSDCANMYKLEGGKLYKRKAPVRFFEDLKYNETPEKNFDVSTIVNSLNNIPQAILESEEIYGCPGCVDEPFINLIFTNEGKEKNLRIDTKEYALTGEVKIWVNNFLKMLEQLP